jgi:hypothetical protein
MCDVVITKTLTKGKVITDTKIFVDINADKYYELIYNTISYQHKANKLS